MEEQGWELNENERDNDYDFSFFVSDPQGFCDRYWAKSGRSRPGWIVKTSRKTDAPHIWLIHFEEVP